MIVVMRSHASRASIDAIVARVRDLGLNVHLSSGDERTIIGVVGVPLPATLQEQLE